MSLVLLAVCGITLGPLPEAPPVLASFYSEQYGCTPEVRADFSGDPVARVDLPSFFPAEHAWWPVFTEDQISSPGYRHLIDAGIKPGIMLPENSLDLLSPATFMRYRQAMRDGAVPVQAMSHASPDAYGAKATFAAAMGVRPLAALVTDGWSDNLLAQAPGSYLIDHRATAGYNGLPLPPRDNRLGDSHFYYANARAAHGGGYSIIINPVITDASVPGIRYPELGISWRYSDTTYQSTLDGLDTSLQGHLLAVGTLFSVPVGLIFARPMPDILSLIGTSVSWISVVIGGCLLLLLAIAALHRLRRP